MHLSRSLSYLSDETRTAHKANRLDPEKIVSTSATLILIRLMLSTLISIWNSATVLKIVLEYWHNKLLSLFVYHIQYLVVIPTQSSLMKLLSQFIYNHLDMCAHRHLQDAMIARSRRKTFLELLESRLYDSFVPISSRIAQCPIHRAMTLATVPGTLSEHQRKKSVRSRANTQSNQCAKMNTNSFY